MGRYQCINCGYELILSKTDLEDWRLMCPMCLTKLKVRKIKLERKLN